MSKNVTTTSKSKHVDVRTKYINEYVEDGVLKNIFIRSKDNNLDIMTKKIVVKDIQCTQIRSSRDRSE